ncbi:MAG TPA: hypothetical protein VHO48_09975 [Anaerolineaceae bacterium]|nr:hypothetical protein [Anaerolineaceae bacterium]
MGKFFEWLVQQIQAYVAYLFALIRAWGDYLLGQLLLWAGNLFPSVNFTPMQSYANQINYFFPLSEVMALALVYLGLWTGVFVYRAVKSWVPTVSGS